jgi:methionyl-tRNA formyltransferase
LRVVFMGSPQFAVPPLERLLENGHQVVAVYTPPDRPAGRGRASTPPPFKIAAESRNIPVIQLSDLKSAEAAAQLASLRPEAVVVAAFGQILPPRILDIPCYGCLNIHPSLLPKFRGPSPVPAAVLAGDQFAGVSLMRLNAGMDSGPIFSRAQIPVLPFDTSQTLLEKLFKIGAAMLTEILAVLPAGNLIPEPQNEAEASFTREISREDGRIDWALPADKLWRQVRAYQPWPGAYTYWHGKQLKLLEVVPLPATNDCEHGRVVELPDPKSGPGYFGVATGNGVLRVLRLQIEGKRAMLADEFLRGQPDFIGAVLGE